MENRIKPAVIVDEYIASFKKETQQLLKQMRSAMACLHISIWASHWFILADMKTTLVFMQLRECCQTLGVIAAKHPIADWPHRMKLPKG
jgi:hypothetical protein